MAMILASVVESKIKPLNRNQARELLENGGTIIETWTIRARSM